MKKKYLDEYEKLNRKICMLIETKEYWQTKAERVTPLISGMPKNNDGESQREIAMCHVVDLDREIDGLIDCVCTLRASIKQYIKDTDDWDSRLLKTLFVEN
ncbi:MAG: hypothetical protein ACOX4U_00540 [Anaerovoracaceae bacterium]